MGMKIGTLDTESGFCLSEYSAIDACNSQFLDFTVGAGKTVIDLCRFKCISENGIEGDIISIDAFPSVSDEKVSL